jgi:hypothetical protein
VRPNLFIVGQPKSGTSALFSFLKQHPAICACSVKEPQFFCDDINSQYFFLSKTERTLENYLGLYPDEPATYYMEASTAYLYSKVAAGNIHAFNPEAKIIIMLREPVDFLFTYHRQLLRNSCKFEVETDFLKALALEPDRRAGNLLPKGVFEKKYLYYSERVKYLEHIKRFELLFEPSQIKIILYDDFRRDNEQVFRAVLDFLDLDATRLPTFREVNKQVAVRSRVLKQFLDRVLFPFKSWARRTLSRERFHQLRELYRGVIFSKREVTGPPEQEVRRLKARFADEVAALGRHLDRDLLSEWNYPPVSEEHSSS